MADQKVWGDLIRGGKYNDVLKVVREGQYTQKMLDELERNHRGHVTHFVRPNDSVAAFVAEKAVKNKLWVGVLDPPEQQDRQQVEEKLQMALIIAVMGAELVYKYLQFAANQGLQGGAVGVMREIGDLARMMSSVKLEDVVAMAA